MATKPASKTDWTLTNAPVRIEPTAPKKNTGWNIDERPAREYMNWLFFNILEWQNYLEEVTDDVIGLTGIYQAYVGVGPLATHADLNAVMADGAIGQGARILVVSPLTINTVQQITKNNLLIEFVPTAIMTKGTAIKALQISATGVQIVRANIQNFIAGGDEAIRIDVASDNTSVQFCRFKNNTTDVNDLSATSDEIGSMTLV